MDNRPKVKFTRTNGIESVVQFEQFSVLIGRNGSGKSELLNLMNEKYVHQNSDDEHISFSERKFLNFGKDLNPILIKFGSLILIDNIEHDLDPSNIRKVIKELKNLAYEKDCVVIGITYSPVVLNEFKEKEYSIFVFPDSPEKGITPLDEFKNPDWMSHFSLGDLYDREELFD